MSIQNKYAVLIGINDYYIQPGVKHGSSLHGCVNDANAMKGLLLSRFGFNEGNIQMLYNEKATKKNVITTMHDVLQKCKPGDAIVFYYSGHGAWMSNAMNKLDVVKRGMSQSMVMSDLYSPNLECLLTDEMLKQIFNEFIDKNVTVTAVFDCCFSGNLAMGYSTEYWMPLLKPTEKSLILNSIYYVPEKIKPAGCRVDALGKIIDTLDRDHDGVPDCMDWEIDSPPFTSVDSLGVCTVQLTAEDYIMMKERAEKALDSLHFTKYTAATNNQNAQRSFNLKDALTVLYPLAEQRPSDRKNSNFISMSAASDIETGAEITDESELKHGAFTKALLTVYKKNPADISLDDLLKKIKALMQLESYEQHPTWHPDPQRLSKNFIGTSSSGFSNTIIAKCISAKAGMVTLDKGLYDGVAKGNIFKSAGTNNGKIQIIKAFNDSAVAVDKSRLIKPGDKLELTDSYTSSEPFVKIFIPTISCSVTGFEVFFNSRIKNMVDQKNYADIKFRDDAAPSIITMFNDGKNIEQMSNPGSQGSAISSFVFLPVPSYIVNALKKYLAKDQNIKLVDKADGADFVLYLNYIKKRPDNAAGYVFYYHPPLEDHSKYGTAIFNEENIQLPSLNIAGESLQQLSQNLYNLTKKTIRYTTTHWINTDAKR